MCLIHFGVCSMIYFGKQKSAVSLVACLSDYVAEALTVLLFVLQI